MTASSTGAGRNRTITIGSRWLLGDDPVTVTGIASTTSIQVETESGGRRNVRASDLRSVIRADSSPRTIQIHDVDDAAWRTARRLQTELSHFDLEQEIPSSLIGRLATTWQVSRATVWRRVRKFRNGNDLTALLPKRSGMKAGTLLIAPEVDVLIAEVARRWWHQTENATLAEIAPSVEWECRARGLPAPSRRTISRRLRHLRTQPESFSKEAKAVLRDAHRLMRGSLIVKQPLSVVQIDHTLADVLLVDPINHAVVGRPTLTLALDIATRSVLGFCASFEAPSSLAVGLCLEHAVFPKDAWLASLGTSVEWPMYGVMHALHSDNGKEFHSRAFLRGCDLNRIEVIYRPPATPRFGGHIERLMGTLMRSVRLLPGNTYSDMLRRRPRKAESGATLTLADFKQYLTEQIARYHHTEHRILGMTPRLAWEKAWRRAEGVELPPLPVESNRTRFLLDFLPLQRRVVGREGIELFRLQYWHAQLANEVDPGRPRVVRFDPRNLTCVYLECAAGSYLTVPLRDRTLPDLSLWEWRDIRKQNRLLAEQPTAAAIARQLNPALQHAEEGTALRRNRRKARRAEWQAVQNIHALPLPDTRLDSTLSSSSLSDELAWEILE